MRREDSWVSTDAALIHSDQPDGNEGGDPQFPPVFFCFLCGCSHQSWADSVISRILNLDSSTRIDSFANTKGPRNRTRNSSGIDHHRLAVPPLRKHRPLYFAELIGSTMSGNVCVFLQLIFYLHWTMNQLNKNQNIHCSSWDFLSALLLWNSPGSSVGFFFFSRFMSTHRRHDDDITASLSLFLSHAADEDGGTATDVWAGGRGVWPPRRRCSLLQLHVLKEGKLRLYTDICSKFLPRLLIRSPTCQSLGSSLCELFSSSWEIYDRCDPKLKRLASLVLLHTHTHTHTWASSSENSLMLDSEDELTAADCSDCRSASSLAYFFTYSDTFFLYSSGLQSKGKGKCQMNLRRQGMDY